MPPPQGGCTGGGHGNVVAQVSAAGGVEPAPFTLDGDTLTVTCAPGTEQQPVLVNGDDSTCFLYSKDSGLPAPPLSLPCSEAAAPSL